MPVADLHRTAHALARPQLGNAHITDVPAEEAAAVQRRLIAEDDLIRARPDLLDIHGPAKGKAEAPALSDGVVDDAPVPTQDGARLVDEGAFAGRRRVLHNIVRVAAIRHKADLLGIAFFRHGKSRLRRDLPNLRLGVLPEGQGCRRELLLREPAEHVGLVLFGMQRRFQRIAAVFELYDPGIMAGGHVIRLQHPGIIQHPFPFHVPVAGDAGIGRQAAGIGLNKRRGHMLLKIRRAVERIKRDPELPGDRPRVVDLAAAALRPVRGPPGPKRETDHLVPRFF